MKFINGIPIIWDEVADKKLFGNLFGQSSPNSVSPGINFPEFPQNSLSPDSPFGENSLFNQSDWKRRLERLLSEQNITEFIYSNSASPDGILLRIRIRGILVNRELKTEINSFTANNLFSHLNKGTDYTPAYPELNHLKTLPVFWHIK